MEPPNCCAGFASGLTSAPSKADVPAVRACERQHVGERDTGPRRGTGGARTPRRLAGNVADGDQADPPVARALQGRGHFALAQGVQGKVQLSLNRAVHAESPRGGVVSGTAPCPRT